MKEFFFGSCSLTKTSWGVSSIGSPSWSLPHPCNKNIMQNRQSSTFFMNSYTSLSGFILPQNMHSLLFFSVIHRKSHPAIVFGGEMNTQNDYLKYSIQWRMKIIICSSCYLFSSFWSASLPWSYVSFHANSSPYKLFIKYGHSSSFSWKPYRNPCSGNP